MDQLYIPFASSHIFYFLILTFRNTFVNISNKLDMKPYNLVNFFVILSKVSQVISMYCLTFKLIHLDNCQYNMDYYNITINLINVFSGQLLNYHVYKQLGIKGVCYGVFFGEHIPWVTEFPFNIKYTDHPQYLGSWLTYIAILDLYKKNIYCNNYSSFYNRISNLQILITILYFLSAKFETYKYRQFIKNR